MGKILSVQNFLELPDAKDESKVLSIPGMGDIVIKPLSLAEHRQMRKECWQGDDFDEMRWFTLLVVHGVADPKFSYDEASTLIRKRLGLVDHIVENVLKESGLTVSGELSKAAVDEAEESFRQESGESESL